ncbi:hypothetical protein DES41_109134 [Pseudorhodoferax soli]|uniref:Uncharacterized protein n=1 Tax=Pseudorhodoferax soli TaxID=545864 RepID=A0A368XHD0_9BURK|nr:hypothetical protein DES41_109134 [Pseudorhodoferax soli]
MAHVNPGARGAIVWQFNQAGAFAFAACSAGIWGPKWSAG